MNPHVKAAAQRALKFLAQPTAGERTEKLPGQSPNDPIKLLLDDLATKTGALQFGTDDQPRYVPTIAASVTHVGFQDVLPTPVVSANTLANMFFESDALRAAIYKNSAYLKAGVSMAVIMDPNADTTREIIHAAHTYCTAEPLNFEFIAGETYNEATDPITGLPVNILTPAGELTTQPAPFAFHSFKIAEEASAGATFTLSRRTLKDTPQYALHGLLYESIAKGIAQAIDTAMATYLGSLTLAPFILALAAARGLSIDNLAGVTAGGNNASLVEGCLYLKGIPAELCAATGDYILAANKFAVAVPQSLTVTAKRLTNGAVEFTVWTNIEVLATTQSNTAVWTAFWSV